jgi:hypothetical protein
LNIVEDLKKPNIKSIQFVRHKTMDEYKKNKSDDGKQL